jgi:hypothetical protein
MCEQHIIDYRLTPLPGFAVQLQSFATSIQGARKTSVAAAMLSDHLVTKTVVVSRAETLGIMSPGPIPEPAALWHLRISIWTASHT